MNLEDRISKLEKSNKRFKIVIALCLCMFMVSAKDIFIKDEIKAKKIIVDEIQVGRIKFEALEGQSIQTYNLGANTINTTDFNCYGKLIYLKDVKEGDNINGYIKK